LGRSVLRPYTILLGVSEKLFGFGFFEGLGDGGFG
jgi:hypothetical protein